MTYGELRRHLHYVHRYFLEASDNVRKKFKYTISWRFMARMFLFERILLIMLVAKKLYI